MSRYGKPRAFLYALAVITFFAELLIMFTLYMLPEISKPLTRHMEEREQVQRALCESEGKYRQLTATPNDAIFIVDAGEGVVIEANQEAGELLGLPILKLISPSLKGDHNG